VFFSITAVVSLSLIFGCSNTPPARIGATLKLAPRQSLVGPWLSVLTPFKKMVVDSKLPGLAVGRREAFLADARDKRLDARSLERAFGVAQTVSPGTASITAAVHPAESGGRKAWMMVQAWGRDGAHLDKARVWLIDSATGDVLDSASAGL
jgi:hypothetical protein